MLVIVQKLCCKQAPAHSHRPFLACLSADMAGSEASAANHHPGDSPDTQNCFEPSPDIQDNRSINTKINLMMLMQVLSQTLSNIN